MAGLVQLKTFNDFAEAQIAKSALEAHDIPVFLFDENLGGNWVPGAAFAGFRLMVPEDCLEVAVRVLEPAPEPLDWPNYVGNRRIVWATHPCS